MSRRVDLKDQVCFDNESHMLSPLCASLSLSRVLLILKTIAWVHLWDQFGEKGLAQLSDAQPLLSASLRPEFLPAIFLEREGSVL